MSICCIIACRFAGDLRHFTLNCSAVMVRTLILRGAQRQRHQAALVAVLRPPGWGPDQGKSVVQLKTITHDLISISRQLRGLRPRTCTVQVYHVCHVFSLRGSTRGSIFSNGILKRFMGSGCFCGSDESTKSLNPFGSGVLAYRHRSCCWGNCGRRWDCKAFRFQQSE